MTVEKRVRFKSWWLPWVLVAPQLTVVLVFFFWPAAQALYFSAGERSVITTADLDAESVRDTLVSIYRPMQSRPPVAMQVTFGLDLLLFRAN